MKQKLKISAVTTYLIIMGTLEFSHAGTFVLLTVLTVVVFLYSKVGHD